MANKYNTLTWNSDFKQYDIYFGTKFSVPLRCPTGTQLAALYKLKAIVPDFCIWRHTKVPNQISQVDFSMSMSLQGHIPQSNAKTLCEFVANGQSTGHNVQSSVLASNGEIKVPQW